MKSLNERRLIELAFGDLPAEAEAQVAADPVAKERLAEYRQMKAALSQMREIPEHQLSTERMRQAILNRGVTRRRRFVFERLGYVAAACAIFFVSYSVARHARTSGSPVLNIHSSSDVAKSDPLFGGAVPGLNWDFPVSRPAKAAPHRKRSSGESEELAGSHRTQFGTLAEYSHGKASHPEPKGVSHARKSVQTPEVDGSALAENSRDSGVLVIEDASDTATGLSNAKEVASKSAEVGG